MGPRIEPQSEQALAFVCHHLTLPGVEHSEQRQAFVDQGEVPGGELPLEGRDNEAGQVVIRLDSHVLD